MCPEPLADGGSRSATPASGAGCAVTEVAYIGGAGRSGSTVLALLLAQLPGFVAVGGVSNLWERGVQRNYLCGCGVRFRECPFWARVGAEAFGGWDAVDADRLAWMKSEIVRYRRWPWHLAPGLRPAFSARVAEYAEHVARVYAAIRAASGAGTVIDSSHDAMSALVLRRASNVNLRILHLVRDSRAVAFSLSRRRLRPEAAAAATYMPRYRTVPASLEWTIANLPYHAIPRGVPRLRVRYEALSASPASEVARVARFLGADPAPGDLSALEAETIEISDNHMISGNPHRLGRTSVRVRLDDEWRSSMRTSDRAIVTAITFPLSVAYGYVGAGHRGLGRRHTHLPNR